MPAASLFDQLREQSRPSFEPEPLDTGRIVKDVDTRLAKESADYAKGQEQAAKDAAKQQVQGLREKGYTVVHDEAGNPAPLTATNGEPVRRKAGSRIHVGEQTGTYYEPDLQKGGLKPAVGQKRTDKNGRIIEDFGGGLVKDHGEDPAWAKQKEDKTLLTKAEAAIRDKMLAPPPKGMDVVKTKKDYSAAQKALAKAEKDLEIDPTDKDYLAAHAKAKADLDAIAPKNEAVNQWSKSKAELRGLPAQIKTHLKLLREGAFTDEHRKQWQSVVAPPAAPAPATVTPVAPTAGSSGQAALQASKQPMSESPTAAPTANSQSASPQSSLKNSPVSPTPAFQNPQGIVSSAQPNQVSSPIDSSSVSRVGLVSSPQPITPAPREQEITAPDKDGMVQMVGAPSANVERPESGAMGFAPGSGFDPRTWQTPQVKEVPEAPLQPKLTTLEETASLPIKEHAAAIEASDAALKQNFAALKQKEAQISAPVAAVDAKLSAWQAKSQAALASGDSAISMRQTDGTMSPLFAASTKKELQDLYLERQKAQTAIAPQLEELDGEFAAHGEDVDAHNRAIENLNGKIESANAEQETKRQESLKALRSQPETAPIADKIDALDKETTEFQKKIESSNWDDKAKEAAVAGIKAQHEAKMKDINKVLNRGSIMGLAQRIYANTTDAEKKKQAERSSLKNYDSEGGYSGPSEKELADTYDSPVNAKVASALNHAGLSSDEIKPYLEDVKNLDFGRNQKESALLSDGNLVVNPKNYLREDDYKTAIEASGATEEQKKAALDRFPKLQQKAAADLYSSIQETDPALLKREVDVMPGETDADKMTAYMNRGYLPRLWTQIRAELGANISGLQKGVLGIAAAVAGATDKGYKALGLPDLATGEVSDYLHEKALGFAKDQQSDSQVAGLMNTGKVGGALSAVAGFVPDLVAMGAVGKVAQSVRFLTGVGSETIAGIDAATAATRAAAATGDVKKGMEAYGQLLKAQGVTADALGEKLATLKSKLASFGGKPLPGDVLSVMEELGGKKLSGLVAKEAGTGANAAAAYFAGKGGGETYVDAYDKTFRTLTEKGVNPDAAKSQAQASALVPALVNGAITYALFKNKSLGDITDNALETEAMLKRTMSDVLKSIGQHAAIDAGKLGLDTLAHGIVAKATYDPEKSPASILEESLQSALTGALMGGVIRAVHEFAIRKSGGKAAGEKPTDTEPQSPNPDVPPNLPGGLPVEVKTAASDAELKANPNGGDPEKAFVLRDIATGANVATMTEGELNAVGLTHKGDKVVPITGKDAPTPAVQVTGDGKAIILQPALDELRATFPATAEFVTMDEKQAREKFAQNGNTDTSPIEPSVENAAPPTVEVAPEPRVEPTPSGEVAAKPVVPNPAAVAKAADIAATFGKQSATNIQEKLSPLHPKVTKVIDGMISAYGKRGVKIVKGKSDATSGIEYDALTKVITLDLPKIQANVEGADPNDAIDFVRNSVNQHELVHLISTTDKAVGQHLDNLWSQLSDEDKALSAMTYYKGSRDYWRDDFQGKHEFLVQLVQAAEDGKLEPALLKILKGNSKSLFETLRQLMDALIARLQRILTDPKHKAHEAAKKTLEAFKAARARLFAEPVGKVDTTSGLTDKGETEGDLTTGLARKTTNPAEGGQSKSGIGNRPVASNESPDASSFASGVASKVADSGDVATVDVKAHEAAASPHNDLTPPTPAQIEADNYKVGKVRLAGEDISIETPAGAKRREEWPALKDHYGRILGTKGADGELLDIFIKEGTPLDWNGPVFVVNQNKPDGTFDETKAIAGAKSVAEAREIYKRNYSKGWKGLGGIIKYDSLKDWVESDHSGKATKKGNTQESDYEKYISRFQIADQENQKGLSPELRSDELYIKSLRPKYLINDPVVKGLLEKYKIQTGEKIGNFNASYILQKLIGAMNKAGVSKTTPSNKGVDVKPVNVKTGGMETLDQITARAETSIKRLDEDIQDRAKNNLGEGTPKLKGFTRLQRELDELDAEAPNLTLQQFKDRTYFKPPNQMMRWSYAEHRPLTRQEADIINSMRHHMLNEREYAYGSGKKIKVSDWPIVQAGDLPTVLQSEQLPHMWHTGRAKQFEALKAKASAPAIIPPPPIPQPTAEVVQPPAPPKPETETAPPQLVAETLRASRDTLFDLPPRKRSLSGMRDAVSKRLDELERQEKEKNYPSDKSRGKKADDYEIREAGGFFLIHEKGDEEDAGYPPFKTREAAAAKVKALNDAETLDNRTIIQGEDKLRERIDRLRTLLGKIERAMAPAGTGGSFSAETQRQAQREAINADARANAQSAMDKRLADRQADVAAAEADGWEVKRFEEKSSKRGGRPFTGWEVTHNGQRVKYGFSSKGEADDRMIRLHKAGVTRPKAEQNQATREELKVKGATSVVKAAEPTYLDKILDAAIKDDLGELTIDVPEKNRSRESLERAVALIEARGLNASTDGTRILVRGFKELRAKTTEKAPALETDPLQKELAHWIYHNESIARGTEGGKGYAVGSGDIEYRWRADALRSMRDALKNGKTVSEAAVIAKADARKWIANHNSQRPKDLDWKRWEGSADTAIENIERFAKAQEAKAPEKAPELMTPEEATYKVWPPHKHTINAPKNGEAILNSMRAVKKDGVWHFDTEDGSNAPWQWISDPKTQALLNHQLIVKTAIVDHKPVSAPAVDAYKLTLPEGYVRDGDIYRYEPTNPTQSTTPAEGQSTGGVVEGEKAPTAQEWKALYEEHQALLAASKDNPQAWKPQEWQAHRSALMKREANSRKVPAVWSHNELITATGKYELDHETGELTKLQPLSEIGFLRNVDSLFKDSIPESGIDGGNDLARKLWAKVKAERAEGEQRKADAAAKAQAESKVKAEEQAKLDATATERRAAFVATIGTPKFKAVKYTDLAGNVFGGQQLGNWVIYKPKGSSNYSIVDEPSKMGVNGLLQDRNVSQADAREIAAWLNRANEGFSGELAKNTDQLGKLRATLTAWRDGGAPAWFKGKAEAPESVKPDEITSSDLPQVGDRVSWIDDSGHKAVSTIERISDGKGRVDHFGMKFVDMSRFTLEKKSTARLKREGIVETPATPKETSSTLEALNTVATPYGWSVRGNELWNSKNKVGTIELKKGRIRILDNAGTLRGTLGNADGLGAYLEKTYYATKKAVETTTEDGSPKETDKPPASSDVVKPAKQGFFDEPAPVVPTAPGVSSSDIPLNIAERAHSGTSWTPDRRARGEQRGYVSHMNAVWEDLQKRASTDSERELAATAFENYRQKWVEQYKGLLSSRSGLISTMIAGGSKFPVERQRKKSDTYGNRLNEFLEWDKKAQRRMRETVRPTEARVISADRSDAVEVLQKKIDDAKKFQERMKAANSIVKSKKLTDDTKVARLMSEVKLSESNARALLKPDFAGRIGFAQYELTNNNANIKRMEGRVSQIAAEKARPVGSSEFEGGRVEENDANNRIQIFFDAKPSAEMRDKLKANGFHWSPNEGAWQRQRNANSRYATEQLLGVKLTAEKSEVITDEPVSEFKTQGDDESLKLQSSPVTSEQDAEYMKAVDSGDMETAQRMVDEAAKKAGYESGKVLHSTNADFSVFGRERRFSTPKGIRVETTPIKDAGNGQIYVTEDRNYSSLFGDRALTLYHRISYPADFRELGDGPVSNDAFDAHLKSLSVDAAPSVGKDRPVFERLNKGNLKQPIRQAGFDGFQLKEQSGNLSAEALAGFDTNQFKSADPITRDASGRIIPLSERFNPSSDSILYSQSPNSDEYWSYNTLVKWMTDNGIPVDMTREEYEGEVARRKGIIEPPVHDTTQAGTAQMREQGGYEEYIKNEPRSFREKVWPEALQIVGKEPFKGTELVKELLDSPRALEDTERAILTHESLRRQKAYDKSIDDLIAAKPEDYAAAEKKMMAAREAHQEGLEALDMAGSKAGSALGAIRLMIKNDFSLGRLERRFRAALGPKPTPEEIKEADAKAAELAKVIKKNDELTEQIRSQLDEIAGLKAAMKAHEHGLTPKADRKAEIKEEDDALARLKSRRKLSSSDVLASPSPEDDDFNDLSIFGRRFIRDGASDLTSFTTAFNAALPGALGDNASAVYEAAKVKFKEAEAAALKDSTPTGVTNKIKGKRAEIADLKASDLNNLAIAIVQHETVKDVDTLRAKMHERLEEIFPHITEKDVSKAWTGFEKAVYPSSDPFRKLVSDLRAQEQLILKVQTLLEEERLALKSGRQPPPRTDAQRKLIREYNDLVKASGLTTSDPEKQLASNQNRIINALRNRKADLEAQVDAKKRESRANVTTPETPEMKSLRDEIAALNAKLDILDPRNTGPTEAQKIKMAESGLKKSLDNVDKEIAELSQKIKKGDLSEPAPATKTSVTSPTIVQLRKALEAKRELRDDLANQLDDLREAAKPVVDPVMKVLGKWEERQNLATVKAPPRTKSRLEELSKRYLDSESPRFVQDAVALGMSLGDAEDAKLILDAERIRREEIALAALKRRTRRNTERQIARAQAFDEDSPLGRKTPAERKLDDQLRKAEFDLHKAKEEANRAEFYFNRRHRTGLQKATGTVGEAVGLMRAIMTGFDLSAVLRQGKYVVVAHPLRALSSFPAMFKAAWSEANEYAINKGIAERPNARLYKKAKLALLDPENISLTKMEEEFQSRWAKKIPLLKASERAYTTFLNKLRADSFDALVSSLTADGQPISDEDAAILGDFVNNATGRGTLGKMENAAVTLNKVFFAPKFLSSRLQFMSGKGFVHNGNKRTRWLLGREYARTILGFAVLYGLASLFHDKDDAPVELDPRSTNFAKIRFGNTRVDPLAGAAQLMVFGSRIASGQTKNTDNKIVDIRGKNVPFGGTTALDLTGKFIRSKLAPAAGMVVNAISGTDYSGKPVTVKSQLQGMMPMVLGDVLSVAKEQGVEKGMALSILSLFGESMQTYDQGRVEDVVRKYNKAPTLEEVITGSKKEAPSPYVLKPMPPTAHKEEASQYMTEKMREFAKHGIKRKEKLVVPPFTDAELERPTAETMEKVTKFRNEATKEALKFSEDAKRVKKFELKKPSPVSWLDKYRSSVTK